MLVDSPPLGREQARLDSGIPCSFCDPVSHSHCSQSSRISNFCWPSITELWRRDKRRKVEWFLMFFKDIKIDYFKCVNVKL